MAKVGEMGGFACHAASQGEGGPDEARGERLNTVASAQSAAPATLRTSSQEGEEEAAAEESAWPQEEELKAPAEEAGTAAASDPAGDGDDDGDDDDGGGDGADGDADAEEPGSPRIWAAAWSSAVDGPLRSFHAPADRKALTLASVALSQASSSVFVILFFAAAAVRGGAAEPGSATAPPCPWTISGGGLWRWSQARRRSGWR